MMSAHGEKDHQESGQCSIERTERLVSGPVPDQISSKKQRLSRPVEASLSSEPHDPKLQRTEINVEMKGIRETTLSCSESVVSSRIRTVYDRSSSSSSDKASVSSLDAGLGGLDEGDDSAFSPGEDQAHGVFGGGVRARGLSSDSYYISQTYQISSPSSPRAVSAVSGVGSPRFKSSRTISVGSGGSAEDNKDLHFVDRKEEELADTPHRPQKAGSSQEKKVHFEGVEDALELDDTLSEKMKSARENVQQMIESSYMVSDITGVIDETDMGSTEDATTELKAGVESTATKSSSSQLPDLVSTPGKISNLDIPSSASPDRPLSPVLAYSPGAAIRSYAMEEMAERKSRNNTPDRASEEVSNPAPPVTRPLPFRFGPDSGLDDEGSSVDAFVSEMSQRTSSQPQASVSLHSAAAPAAPLYSPYTTSPPITASEEEDLEAEALDKLVDLQSIQAGYRFHDVGMMLSAEEDEGGICNPAFDDSDGTDSPLGVSSEDRTSSQLPSGQASVISPSNYPASLAESVEYSSVAPRTLSKPPVSVEDASSYKETPMVSQRVDGLSQNSSLGLDSGNLVSCPAQPMERTEQRELLTSPQPDATVSRHPQSSATTPAGLQQTVTAVEAEPHVYPPVSVSRRFNIRDKKFEAGLKSKGAVLRSESVSYEVYYDTPDLTLTLSDCWLRSQNGRWQMSANFTKLLNQKTELEFLETEDDAHIIRALSTLLTPGKCEDVDSVSRFLHVSGLHEFGRTSTTRRVYSLAGGERGELTVELTLPDLGFWTGQVTATVVGARDGLSQALASMDTLWRDTGVRPLCLTGA